MKKPKRAVKYPNKPKSLMRCPPQDALKNAAKSARYEPSQYHCPENGRYASRVKPASRCDHFHRAKDALQTLRQSIEAGRVSTQWVEGFPRFVWHKAGDAWYEATTKDGDPGLYHAHRVEPEALPVGLRP